MKCCHRPASRNSDLEVSARRPLRVLNAVERGARRRPRVALGDSLVTDNPHMRLTGRTPLLALAATLLVYGCGTGGSNSLPPNTTASQAATTIATPTTQLPPVTHYIGTVNWKLSSTTQLTVAYSIGSLVDSDTAGDVPAGAVPAVQACGASMNPSYDDRNVYVPGQVTITFEGPLTTSIEINPAGDLEDLGGLTTLDEELSEAVNVDGTWECGDQNALNVNMSNGQSLVMGLWVFGQVLSNTYTSLSQTQVPEWAFSGQVACDYSDGCPETMTVTFSGPHATPGCIIDNPNVAVNFGTPGSGGISLFGSPPFTLNVVQSAYGVPPIDLNSTLHCPAA